MQLSAILELLICMSYLVVLVTVAATQLGSCIHVMITVIILFYLVHSKHNCDSRLYRNISSSSVIKSTSIK